VALEAVVFVSVEEAFDGGGGIDFGDEGERVARGMTWHWAGYVANEEGIGHAEFAESLGVIAA
jgi:hypothetical protein